MCGICGYWNVHSGRPAEEDLARRMARTLAHRGPDDESVWVEGAVALGQRRLAVVDPLGGAQPMGNEDGSVQVVFNGEIYNHAELRRDLEARGHRFRTRSDTEAIVHAWEEWEERCLERFNGMFAIAVWDGRRRSLLLARDRLGIKPLYWHHGREGVVFGSELKSVLPAPWVPLEWDLEAVDDFLTYEYVPTPRTLLRAVRKLPAGTFVRLEEDGRMRGPDPFWRLERREEAADRGAAGEELRERMAASVRRRLMADVPLGAFLSGGVDSTIVTGLMSRETPGRVRSFSMGFADRTYDELAYAALAAERLGTTHHAERLSPSILELARPLADVFDEPFGDVSSFPTYLLSTVARREVVVALSGDGGDELFAGYDLYRAHRWAARLGRVTRGAPWRALDALLAWLPPAAAKKGALNKAKRFAEGVRRPADLEHARWWIFQDLLERRALYAPALERAVHGRDPLGFYRERLAEGAAAGFSGLQRQLYADVTGYLADDILVKVDRMSMATSLEARVPFLDHEVVEHAMTIPAAWKLAGTGKAFLKEAFTELVPPRIRSRSKEGFSIPMKHWLRGPLRPLALDLLAPERLRDRGWFDPAEVRRLMDEHMAGRQNHAHRLWCLMSLELSMSNLEARGRARTPAARSEVAI